MAKTAIILGATGLTGGILLNLLLEDHTYSKIKVFGRASVDITHPKIEEQLLDMLKLQEGVLDFNGDVVFCCIGTTNSKTPDKELYRKIDHGIPVTAAKLCIQNGVDTIVVISAMGANANSNVFYNKTKGEMERDVLREGIKNTYILQPSLIGGVRKEKRFGERMAQVGMGLFGFLIPKQYKIIQPATIALTMSRLAEKGYSETIVTSEKIKEIADA